MRIALFLALALTACSGASSEAPATESPATETPASPATETPAAETPTTDAVCGTRGAAACPAGTFCDFVAGSNCGADDRGGHCAPIPDMCTREYMPVCGCDGQTHPTACTAHSAGVSVAHDGPC